MLNKVFLIGRMTAKPESKKVGDNTVTNFSIATNKSWKDKQGVKQEKVEFHNCVAWGKLAEIIHTYGEKGKLVHVEGEIETRNYEKDGVKHYRTEIRVNEYKMLGSRSEGVSQQDQQKIQNDFKPEAEEIAVEDIPF